VTTVTIQPGGLRAARLARGWTPEQLVDALRSAAALSGMHSITNRPHLLTMVDNWEAGRHVPSWRYIELLTIVYQLEAEALGIIVKQPPAHRSVALYTGPDGARLSDAEIADRRAARDWEAAPLAEVIMAARLGDSHATDALMFAMMQVKWGAA
jgi:hypothetical protein